MNGAEDNTYREAGSPGPYTGPATPQDAAASGYASTNPGYSGSNPGYAGAPYTGPQVPPPDPYAGPGYAPPYGYAGPPPPPPPGTPNPGLATLLGFIPGVGAMYNGQFAKGIAHIVIFAIVTSLADHVNGIFGLLVAGWVFYMVFDAYQTARARRDGLVVPDPFGLNNIGERVGLQGNPNWNDFVARPAGSNPGPSAQAAGATSPYATDPVTGAPVGSAYASAVPPVGTPYAQPDAASAMPPYGYPGTVYPGSPGPYSGMPYASPVDPAAYPAGTVPPPYNPTYNGGYAPFDPAIMPPPVNRSGLPTGAIWLIGLGAIFLVGSLAHNFYWGGRIFGAFFLLGLGIVLLVQRTLTTRSLYPEGTAASRWNLLHQNRPGIYLVIIGSLQALDSLHIASWHYTWPYLLIAIGLFQVADRTLYNRMLAEGPVYPGGYTPTPAAETTATPSATVPTPDEEVR